MLISTKRGVRTVFMTCNTRTCHKWAVQAMLATSINHRPQPHRHLCYLPTACKDHTLLEPSTDAG